MPDREPGLVVLVLTEDDWSTDVLPRLKILGADLNMIRVFCTEDDGSGSPVFPRDIHILEAMDPSPVLVVVDCWLDTVPPGKKIADPQQARSVLHPWKELATRTDAAVLLLGHTNRIASANARDKYGATYALRQKCRLTLFAQEGQNGELLIGPEKANGAAILPASIFKIDTKQFFDPTSEHDGKVPFLKYEGQSDKTARQHLEDNYAADHATSQKTDALLWLAAFLGPAPRWSNDVHHARELKGISEKAFMTAKRKLNAKSEKTEGDNGSWFIRLPNHGDRIPEGPPEFQEVPQEVPDVPYNSEGTSSDLPRSDGTSSDSSQNEGTSCQEVPSDRYRAKGDFLELLVRRGPEVNWGAPFGGPLHSSHFRERGARSVSGGPPFSSLVKDSFLGGPAPGGAWPPVLGQRPDTPCPPLAPPGGRQGDSLWRRPPPAPPGALAADPNKGNGR
jgi:hypothetical protein